MPTSPAVVPRTKPNTASMAGLILQVTGCIGLALALTGGTTIASGYMFDRIMPSTNAVRASPSLQHDPSQPTRLRAVYPAETSCVVRPTA